MKSAQLVTFLAIASLTVGCSSQNSTVNDAGLFAEAQGDAGNLAVADAGAVRPSPSNISQIVETSANGLEGFVSSQDSSLSKSAQANAAKPSLGHTAAIAKARKSSVLVSSSKAGRDNPFALAEQPDFEVRFLSAEASTSLPPIPNVGLGPEPGASLIPVSTVDAPVELPPAAPTVLVPQEQPVIAIAPNPPQLVVPPSSVLPPVASPVAILPEATSPTALAEAVEIKGVVQLGDQTAVIINEGDGTLSRTVQPGARLVGGQVELRRIETTTAEPQVVLVQNGVEVVRGIGV